MKFENEEINGLIEEYDSNNRLEEKCNSEFYCLTEAKNILEKNGYCIDDISSLIQKIRDEQNKIYEKRTELKNKMKSIRDCCNHDWKLTGWDSHHDFYVCTKCGVECKE